MKTAEEKISSCPFCGENAELILRGNSFTKKRNAEIVCHKCNVSMVVGAIHHSLEWCEEKVIEKWNKRTSQFPPQAVTDEEIDKEFPRRATFEPNTENIKNAGKNYGAKWMRDLIFKTK